MGGRHREWGLVALWMSATTVCAQEPVRTELWSEALVKPAAPAQPVQKTELWSEAYEVPAAPAVNGRASAGRASGRAPQPRSDASQLCVKGGRVEVLSAGQWYPATVLAPPDDLGTCEVHYDGFGSHYDESVNLSRLRPTRSAAPPPPTVPAQVPSGTYGCYTYDAGQLNYSYSDIVFEGNGRYRFNDATGQYRIDNAGRIQFSGVLAAASGQYVPKPGGGAPQVDVNYGGGTLASLSCIRNG